MGLLGGLGASMTLMACYGAPATGCRYTAELQADGGTADVYRCPGDLVNQPDGGTTVFTGDGGGQPDAGASDGGSTDGGADGGP